MWLAWVKMVREMLWRCMELQSELGMHLFACVLPTTYLDFTHTKVHTYKLMYCSSCMCCKMHACLHVCIMHVYVCVCAWACVCVCVCVCLCAWACMCMHAYIYMCKHACIHVFNDAQTLLWSAFTLFYHHQLRQTQTELYLRCGIKWFSSWLHCQPFPTRAHSWALHLAYRT